MVRRSRRAGRAIHPFVDWGVATTEQDLRDVQDLRRVAYRAVGKVGRDTPSATMTDSFDRNAIIVVGRLDSRAIATARVLLPAIGESTEIGTHVDLPAAMPQAPEAAEVSRLCCAPAFWGRDLFGQLISRSLEVVVRHGRRFIFAAAAGALIDVYCEIGAKRVGVCFDLFGGIRHEVLVWDVAMLLAGRGITQEAHRRMVVPVLERLRTDGGQA